MGKEYEFEQVFMRSITPIFILSLPRSGSTLLQRVLASHHSISSVSEPWFLLPMLYPLRENGVYAEYSHALVQQALKDLFVELPAGREDYLAAVRRAALEIYGKLADEQSVYFVDKTPRYHLITDEIFRAFPDGKVIFLWRNPLSVIASILERWGGGKWCLHRNRIDLYTGLENLVVASRQHAGRSLSVKYENLVLNPQQELQRIALYLGLEAGALGELPLAKLSGELGDPGDWREGERINTNSLKKWEDVLGNPFRKAWCRRYLNWVGRKRLESMGYDKEELNRGLGASKTGARYLISDLIRSTYGVAYCALDIPFLKDKLSSLFDPKKPRAHD